MPRGCAMREMSVINRVEGENLVQVATLRSDARPGSLNRPLIADSPLVERSSIERLFMCTTCSRRLTQNFQIRGTASKVAGTRTILVTPLLREGVPIGAINVRRIEVRPFSEKQIKLLRDLRRQAVIAIENVRLFKELQERNAELREALEHQTATSEVLGIISRSPTDVQPVLDAIVESAARVCGIDDVVLRLREGNVMVPRAHFGSIPIGRVEISIDEPQHSLDARAWHAPHSRRP